MFEEKFTEKLQVYFRGDIIDISAENNTITVSIEDVILLQVEFDELDEMKSGKLIQKISSFIERMEWRDLSFNQVMDMLEEHIYREAYKFLLSPLSF